MNEAADILLRPGAVVVIPTDTVYGVVCRAADIDAVDRLFTKVKPRENKPGTIIAANVDQLVELGIKRRYVSAVEQWWPGPVSVKIPGSDPSLEYLYRSTNTLAVRIPDDAQLRKLLEQTGPLMTTSANAPDEDIATTIEEARQFFGDNVDYYLDGGDMSGRPPSTIVRIVDDAIEVVRQGAVRIDENGNPRI